jgi:hypothetical protein
MKSRILMFFSIAFIGIAGCSEPCDDVNCLNGGACNDGTCVCPDGFSGEFCQTTDLCAAITCQNGGACLDGLCDCPDGFMGEFCQSVDPCTNVVCNNGGVCDNGTCDCPDAYTGANCQTEVRDRFIGNYLGSRPVGGGGFSECLSFSASIEAGNPGLMDLNLIGLCGIHNLNFTITDSINLNIPVQTYWSDLTQDSVTFSGTGIRNQNTGIITLYFATYPGQIFDANYPIILTPS